MNAAKVISVNPGTKTLGEFNFNQVAFAAVSRKISHPNVKNANPFKKLVNFLLGINKHTSMKFSKRMLVARLCLASIIILMASHVSSVVLLSIIAVSLILGLCERITTFAGSISLACSLTAGSTTELQIISLAFLATVLLIYSILGPGRYSVDLFIRKDLFITMMKGNIKSYESSDMDYRAYQRISDRL